MIISSTVLWPSSLSLISLCAPLTPSPRKQRCLLSSPYSQLLHKNGKNIALFFLQEITVSGPDGTQEKIEVPIWNGTAANIILMSLGPRCFLFVLFVFCVLYCVFFHVCNSTAANIIIISLTPNWLFCFPCDRIDMLIHIIISKYLS